jgi:hypothetical protein
MLATDSPIAMSGVHTVPKSTCGEPRQPTHVPVNKNGITTPSGAKVLKSCERIHGKAWFSLLTVRNHREICFFEARNGVPQSLFFG